MENSIDKEYQRTKKCADIYADSTAEYVLPDYKGDIRKLLMTDAELRPSGRFSSGGEVEFSGIVVYNIVYADSDGQINSASFTSDYEYKVKCPEENYVGAYSDARVASSSIRLVGPRKIAAKATVAASVNLTERASINISGTAFDGVESPQLLNKCISTRTSAVSESIEREYAEVVASLDGAISDEVNVIYSGAEVEIDDYELVDGVLRVSGDITLFALIKNGEEPIFIAERVQQFEQDIPFSGATSDMSFIPDATVVSLRESINPTESGSDVVLSAIVEFSAVGHTNTDTEIVEDAYMQSCVTENIYDELTYTSFCEIAKAHGGIEGSIERDSFECEGLREAIILSAHPRIESVDAVDGVICVRGEMRFLGVACGVDTNGKSVYAPIKMNAEFAENVKTSCHIDDKTRLEPKITLSNVRGGIDEREVFASVDIQTSVCVFEDNSAHVLVKSDARADLPFEERKAQIRVYYPSVGESLFSIAKKFHTTVEKVAMDNYLSASVAVSDTEPLAKRIMIF